MRIFISLASYCDPLLQFTVCRAVATASAPADLHFGIVDQSAQRAGSFATVAGPARLSYVHVDPLDARGPCWARALAMSFYDGEDWFFQIDSHMDFDTGWDVRLIAQAAMLLHDRPGVVISAYPNPFMLKEGEVVRQICTEGVLAHVVKPQAAFEAGHLVLPFEAHPVESATAVPGFHLGAGCLFAPGRLVERFPYDPNFYFHGEEQALALRLFTHGWDIFHMPQLPVYHLYNNAQAGTPPRPLHWDAEQDAQRSETWWSREQRSRQRLTALVHGELQGAFGLGTHRTVADYAHFSGIDYLRREVAPRAHFPLAG